jgi:hypothetical protein
VQGGMRHGEVMIWKNVHDGGVDARIAGKI